MKPYLALWRAGRNSLHPHAIERLAQQNFDYALSWFGDTPPDAPGAAFVHLQKGAKWPGLEATLLAHWDTISRYRYVWLPDDDLLCQPEQVSRLFSICNDLQLDLAQPALTADSYFSHVITLQHREFQLRFTDFVEIMAPVLSIEMLAKVHPTLKGQVSGYGLDGLWPRMTQMGKVAIIDDTPVKHTRPVGGPNYAFNKKAGVDPVHEDWLVSAAHQIDRPWDVQLNLGGLLQNGDAICLGQHTPQVEAMLQALLSSCSHLPVSAVQLTRYLGNHLAWCKGAEAPRYPRAVLRVALDRALAPVGIRFPAPQPAPAAPAPAVPHTPLN